MKQLRMLTHLPEDVAYDQMASPVGTLTLIANSQGLHAVLWDIDYSHLPYKKIINQFSYSQNNNIIIETKKQLTEYFDHKRKTFDLPLAINGTDFQIQAWEQLRKIPYATTISYAEQAARMGNKNKARAAGMANGRNPISIIIPCHRVIGANGDLVGFGGGIDKKAYLLNLENQKESLK